MFNNNSKRVIAVIFMCNGWKEQNPFWSYNSVKSFKRWHPDTELRVVDDYIGDEDVLVWRHKYLLDLFDKEQYTKVIMLDADTITCSRLVEFFVDDVTPCLATSDIPSMTSELINPKNVADIRWKNVFEYQFINIGVVCYNSRIVLEKIVKLVNEGVWDNTSINYVNRDFPDLIKVIDFPYAFSPVVYNVIGLGTRGYNSVRADGIYFGMDGPLVAFIEPTHNFRVVSGSLFNHDGKLVRCIHPASEKKRIKTMFEPDVVNFFVNACGCDWDLD